MPESLIYFLLYGRHKKKRRGTVFFMVFTGLILLLRVHFPEALFHTHFKVFFLSIPLTKRKSEGTEQVLRILDFLSKSSQISHVIMGIGILDC